MTENNARVSGQIRSYLEKAEPLVPLLFVWGMQQLINAAYDIFIRWLPGLSVKPYTAAAAIVVSLLLLIKSGLQAVKGSGRDGLRSTLWMTVPFWILALGALLLNYIQAVDPFFTDLFRAIILSFFYAQLGVFADRLLVWLGLWLFALCVVLGLGYPGFSPVVLELYGGLSLIGCGIILKRRLRTNAA